MLNISDLELIAAKVRSDNLEESNEVTLKKLSGGRNNRVWRCQVEERIYCAKVYKVDERNRAEREWLTLNLLAEHTPGLAPLPLWYEPQPPAPLVIMRYVSGAPLSERDWRKEQLIALAESLQQIYSITSDVAGFPFMVVGSPEHYYARLELGISQLKAKKCDSLENASLQLLEKWFNSPDREFLQMQAATIFSPGDANLLNRLWNGKKFRFIDFEYAGWSDRALDLADTMEHINAHCFSERDWQIFLTHFELSRAEEHRLQVARRMFATFWVLLLWQRFEKEGEAVRDLWQRQIEHANHLLDGDLN